MSPQDRDTLTAMERAWSEGYEAACSEVERVFTIVRPEEVLRMKRVREAAIQTFRDGHPDRQVEGNP